MMQQDMVLETVESMKDYVPKLAAASERLASDIQTHEGGWPDLLVAYLDGIAWLASAIEGIRKLDPHILADLDVERFTLLIHQLEQALAQQDFVSLCDFLQYEMQPLLQSYEAELRSLGQ